MRKSFLSLLLLAVMMNVSDVQADSEITTTYRISAGVRQKVETWSDENGSHVRTTWLTENDELFMGFTAGGHFNQRAPITVVDTTPLPDGTYHIIQTDYNADNQPVRQFDQIRSTDNMYDGRSPISYSMYEWTYSTDTSGNLTVTKYTELPTFGVDSITVFDQYGNYALYDASGTLLGRFDSNGNNVKRRIYTVEEATRVSKPTGNKIMLRYK